MKKNLVAGLSALLLISGVALGQGHIVNINTADQAALASTPGIGKHRAQAIVEYRKDHGAFKDVHDLTQVKGISEKALQNILNRNPGQIALSG